MTMRRETTRRESVSSLTGDSEAPDCLLSLTDSQRCRVHKVPHGRGRRGDRKRRLRLERYAACERRPDGSTRSGNHPSVRETLDRCGGVAQRLGSVRVGLRSARTGRRMGSCVHSVTRGGPRCSGGFLVLPHPAEAT